ncbi:helix-turn-helix domain-containing protein [Runella sp.]|uniref:helix-turn-helix domain-containing protein n=1 Tax=Runella sp. TaxID=1960881 RepID=UPI003D138FED
MKIGEKIRAIRTLKGLSQENMADLLNMKVLAYGGIERSKTDIKFSRLTQIATALQVTVGDILQFSSEIKAKIQVNPPKSPEELQYKIDKLQLEKQLLEAKLEKAELEASYWQEKSRLVSGNRDF